MKLTVSIHDFGAKSDGTLQTAAIQAAIDHCFLNGGGEVVVPEGEYLIGSIRLRSNITLHLMKNAVLKASRDPEAYFGYLNDEVEPLRKEQITDAPWIKLGTIHGERVYDPNDSRYDYLRIPGSRWHNSVIRAIDAENISIIGEEGAVIDGDNCYDPFGEEKYRGPHTIDFFNVKNIKLYGYTVRHSANLAHNLFFSENITLKKVKAEAGYDGFHASACNNISIMDCEFYTGDDCIAGFANTNLFVENCILNSSCSAFRLGGTNILIKGCKAYAPGKYGFRGPLALEEKIAGVVATGENARNNMLSFFTYYADYSLPICRQPGNILIEDCEICGADRFLHYNFSGNETWQRQSPLKDITFQNILATDLAMPLTLYGADALKVQFKMHNVSIAMKEDAPAEELIKACKYAEISIHNMHVDNFKGDCIIRNLGDMGELDLQNISCSLQKEAYVLETQEEFIIDRI